ncbi:MAG: sigma-70 family RNA polymerase sigma factor [Planctomycetes bacterium]|nr:sigma-70 family RNA polymerase sigma factor [Planctomycetota bacterium]
MMFNKGPANDLSAYIQSISSLGRVTAEQEVTLSQAWRLHKDAEARDALIRANLRLVIAYAKRYAGRGIPLEELVAEGNVGLIMAVDNFDASLGCRFSTYAAFWIRNAVGQVFARDGGRVRMPRSERTKLVALDRVVSEMTAASGHAPAPAEVAARLGWTVGEVRNVEALKLARNARHSLSDDAAALLADERQEQPEAIVELEERDECRMEEIKQLCQSLSERERETIALRFGLDGGSARSISTVASILGEAPRVTQTRLRMALNRLSHERRGSENRARFERLEALGSAA